LQRAIDYCESRIAQLHAMSHRDPLNAMKIAQKFSVEHEETVRAIKRRFA
jgi:hypothetical protein